jgi:hypothetical protein
VNFTRNSKFELSLATFSFQNLKMKRNEKWYDNEMSRSKKFKNFQGSLNFDHSGKRLHFSCNFLIKIKTANQKIEFSLSPFWLAELIKNV